MTRAIGSRIAGKSVLLPNLLFWLVCALCWAPSFVSAGDEQTDPDGGAFHRQIAPLMQKYCNECHAGPEAKAEIDLARFRFAREALADPDTWELVYDMVDARRMPPARSPQPSDEEARMILEWIERYVFGVECGTVDPGRVTVRRLNRVEYTNTVRDLLGIEIDFNDRLPADDVGEGFDNLADVLTITPLLFEKYLSCAEIALDRVLRVPSAPPSRTVPSRDLKGGSPTSRGRILTSTGTIEAVLRVRQAGFYDVVVELTADQAGPEPARARLEIDDAIARDVTVRSEGDETELHRVRVRLSPGELRVKVTFLNDYYKPDAPNPEDRDRNLYVVQVRLIGPLVRLPEDELPPAHRALLVCQHKEDGEPHSLECARVILRRFATRAFRRPITHEEMERLLGLADRVLADGQSFEAALQVAMEAVMISPHFLYRVEIDPPTSDSEESVRPLNGFELATRLSYFLWSTMPDDELFELARTGRLTEPAVLEQQVERMLRDPRSTQLVYNFGEQWLQLRNLYSFTPNADQFPEFDEELRQSMLQETRLFFETIMRENRSVLEFLDADYTWVNEPLARLYGIEGVSGPEFRRVRLNDPRRGGVITQASVLAVTSNPTRTSPVKRGKWILETILGSPPPPPPPGAPPLGEEVVTGKTLKERLQKHRENPSCAVCHEEMDTLGFVLENFDPIGKWRTEDNGLPIDASGVLPGGVSVNGPTDLKRVLLDKKDQFVETLAKKLLVYAIGRPLRPADQCAVDEIVQYVRDHDYRFVSLIKAVVLSEPFRYRTVEAVRED